MTAKLHQHVKAAVKAHNASSDAKAAEFIKDHPLFGQEAQLPRTAALIKDLAQQVGDGLITAEEGEHLASTSADSELQSLPADKREAVATAMQEGMLDSLLLDILGPERTEQQHA